MSNFSSFFPELKDVIFSSFFIFASGNDDLRPVMSGIYAQLNTDGVTFVATDAHKLVCFKRTDVNVKDSASFIVFFLIILILNLIALSVN